MKPLRPLELIHHGVINAAGFFIHEAHIGSSEAKRRTLALWEPGTRVYRHDSSLLVLLPAAKWVDAATAPGTPVVAFGEIFTAAPLRQSDIEAVQPAKDSLVIVRDGMLATMSLSSLPAENPASWLDIDEFTVTAAKPLGDAAPQPARPVARSATLRSIIAAVPAASPKAEQFLTNLEAKPRTNSGSRRSSRGWGLAGLIKRALRAWPSSPALPVATPGLPRRSLIRQLRDLAQRSAGKLLLWSGLAPLLGRRQAQYLARLLQMLEQRDLTEALRHAIPITVLTDGKPLPPALGIPNPRADLKIRPATAGARTGMLLAPELLLHLQQRYKAAAERLEREGRIDEAAFVLAELLQANPQAISLLERHRKFRLAAEIAEARRLQPGMVVRLWLLANEPGRAVAVARLRGAFADAVLLLERSHPDLANSLRLAWADVLGRAGDYISAAEVVWKVPEGRKLAAAWLDHAIAEGGVAAARALPRKLVLDENAFKEVQATVSHLVDEQNEMAPRVRLALAEALEREAGRPPLKTLARPVVRALVRDRARGLNSVDMNRVRKLADFCGDSALAADLPAIGQFSKPALLRDRSEVLVLEFAAGDSGTLPIRDAAELADGRCVVALGEAGVRILARDGRTIAHIAQPAERLVISDHQDRAIALASRGDVWRLARIDLAARTGECWCDAGITAHARDFDGNLWFVGIGDELLALDALEPGFKALWHVRPLGEPVQLISRNANKCSILTGSSRPGEAWVYELPSLILRSRNQVFKLQTPHVVGISSNGVLAAAEMELQADQSSTVRIFRDQSITREAHIPGPCGIPDWPLFIEGDWITLMRRTKTSVTIDVIHVDQGRPCARIGLAGATGVSMRFQGDALVIADDKGRLLIFDVLYGLLRQNLRV